MNRAIIRKRAEEFFQQRNALLKESNQHKPCLNLTIDQLMHQAPLIDKAVIDIFFNRERVAGVEKETLEYTQRFLHGIRETINGFSPSKRFFILQTIDFFNTPKYIGKIIPALLSLEKSSAKHEVLDFVYSTFFTLNRNIETIVSIPELFTQVSLHLERGGLYTLSSDIAKSIENLFTGSIRSDLDQYESDVGKVLRIFKNFKYRGSIKNGQAEIPQIEFLVEPVTALRTAVLEFISQIQTHDLLLLYAKKRHDYYSRFLKHILSKSRFNRYSPDISSLLLAGCLLTNPQLTPDETLLAAMVSEKTFDTTETREAYHQFIDQLSPITVYNIIGDYKQVIVNLISPPKKEISKTEIKSKTRSRFLLDAIKDRFKSSSKPES